MFWFVEKAAETVAKAIEDPLGTAVDVVTQPVKDGLEVVEGLTEGELRIEAASRLGADVAGGMALSELIEWYSE